MKSETLNVSCGHRQAILVRFVCPTNFRGSRWSARCDAGHVLIESDCSKEPGENAEAAARLLLDKLGWSGTWVGGQLHNGDRVFVMMEQ